MYQENEGRIDSLVHLYIDGAFSRRELINRVKKHTGSLAAALAVLRGYDAFAQSATPCPADIQVPEDAPDIIAMNVEFPGEAGTLLGYLAYPQTSQPQQCPGVMVVHENRGLVEHIKDVTRRAARAGFVAVAPDLLSRQGGVGQFPDPQQQVEAYARTTPEERQADLLSTLDYMKTLPMIVADRIGAVGFCAGGGNVWNLAVILQELAAAVPFYGVPLPSDEAIAQIQAPVLAIYAERDRRLTIQMARVMTTMLQQEKTFGLVVYQGVGHAFHNDTGPNYSAEAACDAWARALAWFNKYLRAPRPEAQ